jgi:hypothetical protein
MEIPTVTPTGTLSGGSTQHGQSSKRNKIEINMNEKQVQVLPKQFNPDLVIAGHGEIYRDWQSKSILKRLQPPPKGACEENFYKEVTIIIYLNKTHLKLSYNVNMIIFI